MTERYPVELGENTVGWAEISREGLYARFQCQCQLSGTVMHRVLVRMGQQTEDLGILIPDQGGYALNTRIPIKRLGDGKPVFWVVPHVRKPQGVFYPICPEEPFTYLARIRKAHMETREGQIGIVLDEL